MYRRYSQMGDGNMPLSQINRNRIKNILIVLLLVALIALLVISLPLIRKQNDARASYILRIQTECEDAVRQAYTLSRNAGSDSASNLAKIRCNIYSIRIINDISTAAGSQLLEKDSLMTIQNMVDRYQEYVGAGGLRTGEYATTLQSALEELQVTVSNLE